VIVEEVDRMRGREKKRNQSGGYGPVPWEVCEGPHLVHLESQLRGMALKDSSLEMKAEVTVTDATSVAVSNEEGSHVAKKQEWD